VQLNTKEAQNPQVLANPEKVVRESSQERLQSQSDVKKVIPTDPHSSPNGGRRLEYVN
jgi:hypothetical protein